MSETNRRLMYLASQKFEGDKAIRGAFLLTDLDTKPIEFRCTNPIRPTQLQTMLYGDILRHHILIELIGEPLVRSVKEIPDIILVTENEFLGMRPIVNIPIVVLAKDAQIAAISGDGNEFQMLNSASGRFEPIVFSTNTSFPDDKSLADEVLAGVFNKFDLIEPFTRIGSALEQVHLQKTGEAEA